MIAPVVLGLVSALLLAGCATTRQATREEWMALQQRTYVGATDAQVLAAAERVFRLADETDFTFSYTPQGDLIAVRKWMVYAILAAAFGEDTWTVTARFDGAGTQATVELVRMAAGFPAPPQRFPTFPADLDLFWARVDHILGRTSTWRACEDQADRVKRGELPGRAPDALCNVTMDDLAPGQARLTQPARPEGLGQ